VISIVLPFVQGLTITFVSDRIVAALTHSVGCAELLRQSDAIWVMAEDDDAAGGGLAAADRLRDTLWRNRTEAVVHHSRTLAFSTC